MLDLFQPPRIKPRNAVRVTLADVGPGSEAQRQQRLDALEKARAAPRKPRQRSAAQVDASKQRRRELQSMYSQRAYYRDHEANKARARERMAKVRERRRAEK
jgi:CRISPR/Cas system-associated exonuclease Cas4 (RecB family)